MSIKVVQLTKNSELVKLSIDEQIKIGGGYRGGKPDKTLYAQALDAYSKGEVTISSSGNTVFFTETGNSYALGYYNPGFPPRDSESNNPYSIGFVVEGNNVQRYNPWGEGGS
jgi:hypothetical protein